MTAWITLTPEHRPLPGTPIAVLYNGAGLYCTTKLSEDEDDSGLHIVCPSAGVTWNLDADDPRDLPTHFCQLPPLPH